MENKNNLQFHLWNYINILYLCICLYIPSLITISLCADYLLNNLWVHTYTSFYTTGTSFYVIMYYLPATLFVYFLLQYNWITMFCYYDCKMTVIHVCIYVNTIYAHTFFFIFFSIIVYHRILNMVPCAIQEDFVVYPFYIYQFTSANQTANQTLSHPIFLCNHRSLCLWFYFCFIEGFICVIF